MNRAMPSAQPECVRGRFEGGAKLGDSLIIGLVNNMPDGALKATERQFLALLAASRGTADLHVRLFYLPGIERGDEARVHLARNYAQYDELLGGELDALVVTGTEPRCANLREEPYWPSLARLVEWARHNTVSTIWSCLAAHAAVLHLDGIARRPLPAKISGVYEARRVSEHPLLGGTLPSMRVPHSRQNGLCQTELIQQGYEILTSGDEIGADVFVKACPSLFVFVQGHPEYEADSLHREYRRDMTRFLGGETERCPSLPRGCFEPETERALACFAEQATTSRRADLLDRLPRMDWDRSVSDWHGTATRLFENWIGHVAQAKAQRAGDTKVSNMKAGDQAASYAAETLHSRL